jgi:hypothetical protein
LNPQGKTFTPEERSKKQAEVVAVYAEGATVAETAARVGCSQNTVRNYLVEAGVQISRYTKTLPEGYLTGAEAAALVGVGAQSLAAMHHRGDGPPRTERPPGAHGYYSYYLRSDVEQWLQGRAERRAQRVQKMVAERERKRKVLAVPGCDLDWPALLRAVDDKRTAEGLTWGNICHATGVDPGHISRIRKGYEPPSGLGAFVRLAFWVCGTVPDEITRFTRQDGGTELELARLRDAKQPGEQGV